MAKVSTRWATHNARTGRPRNVVREPAQLTLAYDNINGKTLLYFRSELPNGDEATIIVELNEADVKRIVEIQPQGAQHAA